MYIFKNSMKNLLRNRGRNILIFLILLVTMTAVTTCALVRQAANQQVDECIRSFKPSVSLELDYNKLAEDYPSETVTNIDGSIYYKESSTMPDCHPSIALCEEWEQNKMVDHAEWWLNSEYCADGESFESSALLGGESWEEYYGKDIEFFRNMAEGDFETKKAYYLSKQFQGSVLYEKLYEDGHVVTEKEAEELAARTVFGDEDYQEYLDHGISDELADIALTIKTGYDGIMEVCMTRKKSTGTIHAFTDIESSDYFKSNIVSLQQGNYPYGLGECLVSEKYAEMNGLSIGDLLHITSAYWEDEDAAMDLTISGIFSNDYFDATADSGADVSNNWIFTSVETLKSSGFEYVYVPIPTYYVNSTEDVEAFRQVLSDSGLSQYVEISDNMNELEAMTEPIGKIRQFSAILMIVILVLGSAIFLLLSFLAVCERKYEIGVLRSIGMKKNKVIRGFLYETAVIVMLCCIIGMTVGTGISQPIAKLMLSQNASENAKEAANDASANAGVQYYGNESGNTFSEIEGNGVVMNVSPDENVDSTETEVNTPKIQVQLSWVVILEIFGAAFVVMIAAVVIAGMYVTKFEPIKILSDQE